MTRNHHDYHQLALEGTASSAVSHSPTWNPYVWVMTWIWSAPGASAAKWDEHQDWLCFWKAVLSAGLEGFPGRLVELYTAGTLCSAVAVCAVEGVLGWSSGPSSLTAGVVKTCGAL